MATVEIKISDELLKAAKVPRERSSEEVAKLLALEPYRERAISLGWEWCPDLAALEYQLQLGSFSLNKNPTEVGTLNTV